MENLLKIFLKTHMVSRQVPSCLWLHMSQVPVIRVPLNEEAAVKWNEVVTDYFHAVGSSKCHEIMRGVA